MAFTRQRSKNNKVLVEEYKLKVKLNAIKNKKALKTTTAQRNKTAKQRENRRRINREANRARLQRIRQDPVKHAAYREKERLRNLERKNKGVELKFKNINDLSERERRARRKKQREYTRNWRLKKKNLVSQKNNDNLLLLDSEQNKINVLKKKTAKKQRIHNKETAKLRSKNQELKRALSSVKKKLQRLQIRNEAPKALSPISNFKKTLRSSNLDESFQENLVCSEILKRQFSLAYKNVKSASEKNILKQITSGDIIKKYNHLKKVNKRIAPVLRKRRKRLKLSKSKLIAAEIRAFFSASSTIDPGKKRFVSINKVQYQKEYLNSNMLDLYDKFCTEKNSNVSYETFTRHRPLQCVPPQINDRDTTACIVHENFKMLVKSLHCNKLIKEDSDYEISKFLTCFEKRTENCYSRQCERCQNHEIYFNFDNFEAEIISFDKWVTKKEERISGKTNQPIIVTITKKEKIMMAIPKVVEYFQSESRNYMQHIYRHYHQQNTIESLKKSLEEDEAFIITAFSENYVCKYSTEVQATHFGASQNQVTLLTGVIYTKNVKKGFASLSSCLRHDAAAVMAHIEGVMKYCKNSLASVKKIHFMSDGPTTQYRNKKMFYLITQYVPKCLPTVEKISYNFSEAGHGKSAADAIGGCLKRLADNAVRYGSDIPNFDSLIDFLKKESNVSISSINADDIKVIDSLIPQNLSTFIGTRQTHQFNWIKTYPSVIQFRTLSCFECDSGVKTCTHFHQGTLDYQETKKKSDKKENLNINSSKPKIKSDIILEKNKRILLNKFNEKNTLKLKLSINKKDANSNNQKLESSNDTARRSSRVKKSTSSNIYQYDY